MSNLSSSSAISSSFPSISSSSGSEESDPSAAELKAALRVRLVFAGVSSTTTNDFCLWRSFHFKVREIEWNQSVDCLSAHTVGNGYLEAVILIWSPSDPEIQHGIRQCRVKRRRTLKFHPSATVKRSPCSTARVVGDTYPKFHTIGKEHWAEGKRVRTNGSYENSWNLWMNKRSTSGELSHS